jgi:thiol-disulfide isomerase/thioredoxin
MLLIKNFSAVCVAAALLLGTSLATTASGQDQKPKGDKPEVKKPEGEKTDAKKPEGDKAEAKKGDEAKAKEITLNVGDAAPALKVEKFIKGEPVKAFKPGQVYVVEFWATWCGPCKASMPHLTKLQKAFKDKATFISVNIQEDKEYKPETLTKVEDFVKKNDERMGYTVAFDGGEKLTDKTYMEAAGQQGIPTAFVVTGDGKIAYIGHPMEKEFEAAIQGLVDGKFDMKAAIASAKEKKAQEETLLKNMDKIQKISEEIQELLDDDKVDDALAKMDEIVKLAPQLAPQVEMQKFATLLEKEKLDKAYEIAQKLIDGPAKENPDVLNAIAWAIVDPEAELAKPNVDLAMKAAELAAKQDAENGAILDTLARCYWLKGDKAKAIATQTKAVDLSKDDKEVQESLQATLDEYKKDEKK